MKTAKKTDCLVRRLNRLHRNASQEIFDFSTKTHMRFDPFFARFDSQISLESQNGLIGLIL